MNAKRIAQLRQGQNGQLTSAEEVDRRLRLSVPLEALVNDRLVLVKLGSSASRAASREIAVIDDTFFCS